MGRWSSHLKTWEMARPIYPKNHIVSSDWGPKGNKCHFHPSYNCEEKPDIAKLITMEYARIWATEKEKWDSKAMKQDPNEERQRKWAKKVLDEKKAKKRLEKNNDQKQKPEIPRMTSKKATKAQPKTGDKLDAADKKKGVNCETSCKCPEC